MSDDWSWKKYRQEKNQFRSYYCPTCRQNKPCGALYSERGECCPCIYQREKKEQAGLSSLAEVLAAKKQEWQDQIQYLIILKNYAGCSQCGSKVVDFYYLTIEKQLVCWPCRVAKEGGATGEISWAEQVKWYQKKWGLNVAEWLEKFQCLPVNTYCAQQWKINPSHFPPDCGCLLAIAQKSHQIFARSWQRIQKQIKNCTCQISPQVRVEYYDHQNYGYTYCQSCEKKLDGGGKMGIIKNRNDPRFWGLKVEPKILCLACLKNFQKLIPIRRKRKLLNEYLKRGYV